MSFLKNVNRIMYTGYYIVLYTYAWAENSISMEHIHNYPKLYLYKLGWNRLCFVVLG